jgi:hypothetical protein
MFDLRSCLAQFISAKKKKGILRETSPMEMGFESHPPHITFTAPLPTRSMDEIETAKALPFAEEGEEST